MELFRSPNEERRLADYDPVLAQRLLQRLLDVLCEELGQSRADAASLAAGVRWSVTREHDGLWLNMNEIGVGGTWPSDDEDGLDPYVRQLAYSLVDRSDEFEP